MGSAGEHTVQVNDAAVVIEDNEEVEETSSSNLRSVRSRQATSFVRPDKVGNSQNDDVDVTDSDQHKVQFVEVCDDDNVVDNEEVEESSSSKLRSVRSRQATSFV